MAEPTKDQPIVIVTATDEGYVLPMTVMVRSLLENLREGVAVRLYVLADNVRPESKARAEQSWRPYAIDDTWIEPDRTVLVDKLDRRVYSAVPASCYRLLMQDFLPDHVTKVIYLDADTLVLRDVSMLWGMEFQGNLVLAAPDAYSALYHYDRLNLLRLEKKLEVEPFDKYFNSGVLLVDLQGWRKAGIGEEVLALGEAHLKDFVFGDQDILNCALQGRWGSLPPTWNLHMIPEALFFWGDEHYSRSDVGLAFAQPGVVHFASSIKPWHRGSVSIFTDAFQHYLKRTSWADEAAPEPPYQAFPLHQLSVGPVKHVNWLLWKAIILRSFGRSLGSAFRLLVSNPWILLIYPRWLLQHWHAFTTYSPGSLKLLMGLQRWRD